MEVKEWEKKKKSRVLAKMVLSQRHFRKEHGCLNLLGTVLRTENTRRFDFLGC